MDTSITVRHNFETAHRLPNLPGKCQSLHGHSWWVEITLTAHEPTNFVTDYGDAKTSIRSWIDTNLDHGVMLGADDPLADILDGHSTKVFRFGDGQWTNDPWPTVEAVAHLLHDVTRQLFEGHPFTVTRAHVTETHVNTAEVTP